MRHQLLLVAAVCCFGCATPQSQLTVIERIRLSARDGLLSAPSLPGLSKEGVSAPEKPTDSGSWFSRSVFQPEGETRKLDAVEIIYCPTERLVFTECRVAVAWSRDGKGGLGPQTDVRPAPVEDDSTASEPVAQAPGSPARPSAPAEPSGESILLGGKGYLAIPGADIARLRSWTKKPVLLSLTYGKTTSGLLQSVDASGLKLERTGEAVLYRWEEVQTAAPQ